MMKYGEHSIWGKLVYDGKSVYEIDEDCLRKKEERERQKEMEWQKKNLKQPPGVRRQMNKTNEK